MVYPSSLKVKKRPHVRLTRHNNKQRWHEHKQKALQYEMKRSGRDMEG